MRLRGLLILAPSIVATCILATHPALAAGYGLKEHSAEAMGDAYAGAAATGSDASYLAYNPASLGEVEDSDFAVSLVDILPGSKARYSLADTLAGTPAGGSLTPTNFIGDALVPAIAFRTRISNQWALGLSVSAPWGLSTDYKPDWAGRYYALKTKLLTINVTPSVSYQLSKDLLLGAGLQIEYARGQLSSAIDTGTLGALYQLPGSVPGAQDSYAHLHGSNVAYGYTLGFIDHVSDTFTLGASYRSSVRHDLKGPLNFTLDSDGIGATLNIAAGLFSNTHQSTSLTMPDMVLVGARDKLSDRWSVLAELDWTNWSLFHALRVVPTNPYQPVDVTTTRWKDTFFGSIGAEYEAQPGWVLRAGIGYDQSPTRDSTREPRIPDADRLWLSAGTSVRLSDETAIKLSLARLINMPKHIDLAPTIPGADLRGSLVGSTRSYVNVIGLELTTSL